MPRVSPKRRRPSTASLLRHLVAIVVVLVIAGCGGGGCGGGCSSCGGIAPLAGGFNVDKRVENAGSVRVTSSGLDFIGSNLSTLAQGLLGGMGAGGVIKFEIPTSAGSAGPLAYTLCPNGADPNGNPAICTAEIDLGNAKLTIDPAPPYDIHIKGTLPLRVQDVQLQADLAICKPTLNIALNGNGSCPGGNFSQIPLDVDIAIHTDQNPGHTARFGYSKLEITQVINENDVKASLQSDLEICGKMSCDVICCITDPCTCALAPLINIQAIKNAVVGAIIPTLKSTIADQISQQLCLKTNPAVDPGCPTGTNDVNGVCRYGSDDAAECASIMLGTDGHMNLGSLLASISPGTKGGLDFLFAAGGPGKSSHNPPNAWGDLDPVPAADGKEGATLGMFGGTEPTPLSKCVRLSDLAIPTGIPIPDELFQNGIEGWPSDIPGPHLGFALSERFANYAMAGLYNSGFLCIGISSENIGQLNSGLLSLLAKSSADLGIQREPQQVAIVIRPSTPPTVTFGNGTDAKTDPLLRVQLLQASFDFYIFSLDRFVRFMTATFDLDVPVNLSVTPDGLLPQIKKLGVTNGKVTNSELINEKPDEVALSLASVIEGFAGQALGAGLAPIDLNASLSSLGLKLIIPESVEGKGSPGLRKLTKGTDNYLGLFASFGLPDAASPKIISKTSGRMLRKTVDPAGLVISTMRADNAPIASLRLGSQLDDGTRAIEYSYRVDQGFWHPFSSARDLDVSDEWLRVQGKHFIEVRSRVVGDPMSLDPEPVKIEVVVDVDAPTIKLGKIEDGKATLAVHDRVSEDRSLVRVRLDDNAWSEWQIASSFGDVAVGEASEISIEAKDEEGNIATAQQSLIRGRAIAAAGGCGCAVAGDDQAPRGMVWLLGVALAGIGARLFGRKRAAKPAPVAVAPASRRRLGAVARSYAVPAITLAFASTWAGCNCGVETTPTTTTTTGGCPTCQTLEPGLIGAYTSVAVSGTTIWVAGYAEADWENGNTYGDLVVGKWNEKDKKVDWESVDGVPDEPKPDPTVYNVEGFRGGQTESGEDVGIWTSLAIDSAGNPAVAYYDRTNKALKLAHHDGKEWTVSVVEGKAGAEIGRYAKLLAQNGGFVIAYQSIEAGGDNGAALAKVRVATSPSDKPGAVAWAFEDAVVAKNTPCRAAFCASDSACVAATKLCAKKSDACMPACGSGNACVDDNGAAACAPIFDANKIDAYPDAIGDYIAIAPDPKGGIGIAYYDRPAGDLMIATKASGAWTSVLVDGSDAAGNDTGDMGIGASLAIDASGTYHLTYVDGLTEAVRYVAVTGGKVGTSEIVDDGLGVGGQAFEDGQHLVGDDSHISVSPSGEVRVTYQDATAGTLHYAVGVVGADKHTWTVKIIPQDGFAGAFSSIVEVDGKLQLANWWRKGGKQVEGDVALVSP